MVTLIKNGRVLDPETKLDAVMDVLVLDNYITKIEENIADEAVKNALNENGYTEESLSVIDATGCYVMPGLIDLHVHLREPGQEHKETIRTGARVRATTSTVTDLAIFTSVGSLAIISSKSLPIRLAFCLSSSHTTGIKAVARPFSSLVRFLNNISMSFNVA